jgi:hypothetical protein
MIKRARLSGKSLPPACSACAASGRSIRPTSVMSSRRFICVPLKSGYVAVYPHKLDIRNTFSIPYEMVVALVSTALAHAPGHKTADPHALSKPFIFIVVDIDRPNHCPPGPVRLGDDGTIWHNKPQHVFGAGSLWYAHAIVTVLGFPVGVSHDAAVGVRTAAPPAAFELVKPRLEGDSAKCPSRSRPRAGNDTSLIAATEPIRRIQSRTGTAQSRLIFPSGRTVTAHKASTFQVAARFTRFNVPPIASNSLDRSGGSSRTVS